VQKEKKVIPLLRLISKERGDDCRRRRKKELFRRLALLPDLVEGGKEDLNPVMGDLTPSFYKGKPGTETEEREFRTVDLSGKKNACRITG